MAGDERGKETQCLGIGIFLQQSNMPLLVHGNVYKHPMHRDVVFIEDHRKQECDVRSYSKKVTYYLSSK